MADKQSIPERLRRQVRERANGRCEYCLLHSEDMLLPHQVDHIVAEQHGGTLDLDNLAWSCFFCNHTKGPNIASLDPDTKHIVPLFNPRTQQWSRHFRLNGPRIEPITASGRATANLLQFNTTLRLQERVILISIGHYPR